jgi:hypothetical protein
MLEGKHHMPRCKVSVQERILREGRKVDANRRDSQNTVYEFLLEYPDQPGRPHESFPYSFLADEVYLLNCSDRLYREKTSIEVTVPAGSLAKDIVLLALSGREGHG